jgi:hypothetical protein
VADIHAGAKIEVAEVTVLVELLVLATTTLPTKVFALFMVTYVGLVPKYGTSFFNSFVSGLNHSSPKLPPFGSVFDTINAMVHYYA